MRTVVVGAGAAGLWCALHAADRGEVSIVASDPAWSATALAQGGIAAAVGEGDAPASHAEDTVAAGAGLCDPEAVRVLTEEAPRVIEELVGIGMPFDEGGAPTLEGGHTARRVLHAGGDATGRNLLETLLAAVRADRRIHWVGDRAARLLGDGRGVAGVATELGLEVEAERVVLAAGGACGIFGRRTGPERATGDAMLMAFDAGAALADLEFVQFHPTALDVPGHPARLLTEALRGEGAVLLDANGRRFMHEFDERAELAPRDVVARAILAIRERTGGAVYLDARKVHNVAARFPTADATCRGAGLDLAGEPIPVAPAAHYFVGGVATDAWGRTTLPGLLACGEVACTGVHGANRLASNSLLEAMTFGRRAAECPDGSAREVHPTEPLLPALPGDGLDLEAVRGLADTLLGVRRSGPALREAVRRLGGGGEPAARMAWLLALAALRREESRGAHYRTDHPEPRPEWRFRQAVSPAGWARVPVAG